MLNTIEGIINKFVLPVTETGCWIWMGCLNESGYGVVSFGNKRYLAHRLLYKELVAPISDGLDLDHLCRMRCCVNPRHVEPVTRATNLDRGLGRKHDYCPRGHPYTEDNLYIKKDGTQVCKQCRREHMRRLTGYQGKPPASERTHCPQGHLYSPENTFVTKDGYRHCRECGRVGHRKWWHNRNKGAA